MSCDFCGDTRCVALLSEVGSRIGSVTCPKCVRGVTVLGTHELLRAKDGIHRPGERLDGPTGTILTGLIRSEPDE